jgi:acyl-CoA reductase-like NAD-dependent aldehyde dehydrogenase
MDQTPVRIAGELVTTSDAVEVSDPYDGALIGAVPRCGADEVDAACAAAAAALARRDLPAHRRAAVLDRAAGLLVDRHEEFARLICREAGKPITTARGEVDRCVDTLRFAAGEARHLTGEMVPMDASASGEGRLGFALRVPLGVVAAIAPFNFPLNLVAHKLAPAIAAGCPVVLKPAPQTPLTSLALVELLIDAGLPEDWISVVTDSGREAAIPLVAHDVPAMVTFTGSVHVGWSIAAAAPRKKVALELGSNAPVIVERDADLADVARRIRAGGFGYAGQSCISVQRVLVHRDVHDELVERLAEAAASLVVGDPGDEATEVGPLIDPGAAARVVSWIAAAVDGGGRVATGGELVGDRIVQPTVIADAPLPSDVWCEEIFGPVVVTRPYADLDEAFALANDSSFRLQAGVFTRDLGVAMRAVHELDFGGVLIGDIPTLRADQQPYGGVSDAGNTREGPAYTIAEMTDLRFVSLPTR